MRFTTPGQKAIVVVVLLAATGVLTLVTDALHSEAASVVLTVVQVVGWYLASRVFRGPGEPVRPTRVWWRMTNQPLLSGALGAIYGVLAVVNIGLSFAGYASVSGFVSIAAELVMAWLFLTCFVRLRALAPARA